MNRNQQHEVFDITRLPSEPTEDECALALFQSLISIRPFDDALIYGGGLVLLSNNRGEMYGETDLKNLLRSGAQA